MTPNSLDYQSGYQTKPRRRQGQTMGDDIQAALDRIFATDSELYQNRGFQRRIGYGRHPALLNSLFPIAKIGCAL